MNDHTRYEVNIKIDDNVYNIFVAVPNHLSDDMVDIVIKEEVFNYLERQVKLTYSQILL